jgi:acyl-CoA hydrolase
MSPELAGRFVRESVSEYSEFALPTDANTLGNVLGGKVMHLVDLAAALAAVRHARCPVVTASVDQMTFLHPVHIGQLIILQSSVNRVFRTSMEVGVRVEVEDLLTGHRKHTSSAYLTLSRLIRAAVACRLGRLFPKLMTRSAASRRQKNVEPIGSRCVTKLYENSSSSNELFALRLVHVLYVRLENQQIRVAVAIYFQASLVVPLDYAF